eukprot:g251.t1
MPTRSFSIVGDQNGYELRVQEGAKQAITIPLQNIVGIGFEVYAEKMREKFEGCMIVVTRKQTITLHQWAAWTSLLFLSACVTSVLWVEIGPPTALVVMSFWWAELAGRSWLAWSSKQDKGNRVVQQGSDIAARDGTEQQIEQQQEYERQPQQQAPDAGHDAQQVPTQGSEQDPDSEQENERQQDTFDDDAVERPNGLEHAVVRTPGASGSHMWCLAKAQGSAQAADFATFLTSMSLSRLSPPLVKAGISTPEQLRNSSFPELCGIDGIDEADAKCIMEQVGLRQAEREGRAHMPCPPWVNWLGQLSFLWATFVYLLPILDRTRKLQLLSVLFICVILFFWHKAAPDSFWTYWLKSLKDGPLGTARLYALPEPRYPHRYKFEQSELGEMLAVRERLWELDDGRFKHLIADVCVGNYWMETICSALLWSKLYNSPRWRRIAHLFFNFILPAFFVLQGLAILVPWAVRQHRHITRLVQQDRGLKLLVSIAAGIARFLEGLLRPLLPKTSPLNAVVDVCRIALAPLRGIIDVVGGWGLWIVEGFRQHVTIYDELFIYAKESVARFRRTITPVAAFFSSTLGACAKIVVGLFRLVMSGVNAMLAAGSVVRGRFLTTMYKPFRPIVNMVFRDHARAPHLLNIAKNAALTGYQATTNVRLTANQKEHVSPQKGDGDRRSNASGSGSLDDNDKLITEGAMHQASDAPQKPETTLLGSDSRTCKLVSHKPKSKSKSNKNNKSKSKAEQAEKVKVKVKVKDQ